MVVFSREFVSSQPVDALEILHAFHQAVRHLLLTGTQRHARIVVLLVGLLRPLGVSNPQRLGCTRGRDMACEVATGDWTSSFMIATAIPGSFQMAIPSQQTVDNELKPLQRIWACR